MNEGGQFEDSFAARLHGESAFSSDKRKSKRWLVLVAAAVLLVGVSVGAFLFLRSNGDGGLNNVGIEGAYAKVVNLVFYGNDSDDLGNEMSELNVEDRYTLDEKFYSGNDLGYFEKLSDLLGILYEGVPDDEKTVFGVINDEIRGLKKEIAYRNIDVAKIYYDKGRDSAVSAISDEYEKIGDVAFLVDELLDLDRSIFIDTIDSMSLETSSSKSGDYYCYDGFGCISESDRDNYYFEALNNISMYQSRLNTRYKVVLTDIKEKVLDVKVGQDDEE